jgi:1,4-alpha-glucan branching enzyme
MRRLLKKRAFRSKVSAMLMDVAGDCVSMGEDIGEKRQLLNGAASAWNIACLEDDGRERAIKKYIRKYKKMNPTQTAQDYRDTEEDLRLLIKEKDRLYPRVKVQIAHAEVKEMGDKLHITVMSMTAR